jgi:hypothetical protein
MGINIKNQTLVTLDEVLYKVDNNSIQSRRNLKPKDIIELNPKDELLVIVRLEKKKYQNPNIKDGGLKFIMDRDEHIHHKEGLTSNPTLQKVDTFLIHHVQSNTKEKEIENYREFSVHFMKHTHYLPVSMDADTHIDVNIKHPDT